LGSHDCQIRSVFDDRSDDVAVAGRQDDRRTPEEEAPSPSQIALTDHKVYVWGVPPSADLEHLARFLSDCYSPVSIQQLNILSDPVEVCYATSEEAATVAHERHGADYCGT